MQKNERSFQRTNIILSSRDNPMDQVMSMELGADDYMQKPFYTNVLIAKLQAIYRRVYEFTAEEKRTLTWQDAVVDLSKDSIQKGDQTIFLSKTEMIILEILITKKIKSFREIQLSLHYGMMKHLLVIIR